MATKCEKKSLKAFLMHCNKCKYIYHNLRFNRNKLEWVCLAFRVL